MKRLKLFAALLLALSISACDTPEELESADSSDVQTIGAEEHSSRSSADGEPSEEESEPPLSYSELLECRYFDEGSFFLYDSRAEDYSGKGEVLGGVVPHHLTAGHFISGYLKAAAASRDDIETVVIVAPQHYESDKLMITSLNGWASPFGAVECDDEAAQRFADTLGAECDDEMMMHDHSASSHIPFVKYYLPEAEVACLLVSPRAGAGVSQRIADTLYELSQEKECLFLFSIDFSHYLSPDEADENDAETLAAMLASDTAAIERMGNDNVDSPYCLSAYVRLSELLDGEVRSADNSNTFKLLNYPYNSTYFPEGVTSYFVFLTEKEPMYIK